MIDFPTLLRRDHRDLERGLAELLAPSATFEQIRTALDGVRLGLTAHAEAEDIVLHIAVRQCDVPELEELVAEDRVAHDKQEGALTSLLCALRHISTWRDRAQTLLDMVHEHATYEEHYLFPAIRELAPAKVYGGLAGAFATERMRQLSMLQPSAPLRIRAVC